MMTSKTKTKAMTTMIAIFALMAATAPAAADRGSNLRDPSPEALRIVRLIVDAVGLEPNFIVKEADFTVSPIAYATVRIVDGERRRLIVYDAAKFQWGEGEANWYEIGVMAHEIGHHLGGHVLVDYGPQQDQELEADRFAGFVIGKLGGTREQAMRKAERYSEFGSVTHPGRARRAAAMEAGWRLATEGAQAAISCRPRWFGEAEIIGDRICRLAQRCGERGPNLALACRGADGAWTWGE